MRWIPTVTWKRTQWSLQLGKFTKQLCRSHWRPESGQNAPDKPEGKLLMDLEVKQGFQCLITKPTWTRIEKRGTTITKSLIDVLLSNRPEVFRCSGNYYPCLSDHALIDEILKQKINPNNPKFITFRSYKNLTLLFTSSFCPRHLGTYGNCLTKLTIEYMSVMC